MMKWQIKTDLVKCIPIYLFFKFENINIKTKIKKF